MHKTGPERHYICITLSINKAKTQKCDESLRVKECKLSRLLWIVCSQLWYKCRFDTLRWRTRLGLRELGLYFTVVFIHHDVWCVMSGFFETNIWLWWVFTLDTWENSGIYSLLTAGMMADLERELKLGHTQQQLPQQEPSPSAVMPGSGTSFTFSRASSIGSVNAVSCSSASSTHNTGEV